MRFAVCLCKNKCCFICIASPHFQYMCRKIDQTIRVFMADTKHRQRPLNDASLYILITRDCHMFLDRSFCHCKCIMTTLKMIMAQNGAANNRKIRIGTKEIMREQFDKIKQFDKCISFDLHRGMLAVKHNTVFIVIYIWRILESPWCIIDRDRNDSVVLSRRMINTACVSLVFRAEQTFRITACFDILCCCDRFRIFFRFGKIDRDIDFSIRAVYFPFLIFLYTITADIIAVLTQFVKIIRCFLRIILISVPELFLNLCRTGHQAIHQSGVKEITVNHTVFDQSSLYCFIQKFIQSFFQIHTGKFLFRFGVFIFVKYIQKKVCCVIFFTLRNQS